MTTGLTNVVVVGAGPSGLLLSLMLSQKSIPVTLVDMGETIDSRPRATHYSAPALYELRRAGLGEDLKTKGFSPDTVSWRKLDGTTIIGMHGELLGNGPDAMVCLPLDKLGAILLQYLEKQKTATILFKQKVIGMGQDDEEAWVECESTETGEKKTFHASYIVGCDGANSRVRRHLFGEHSFPGKTWDVQLVATNTYYDFDKFGWDDSNFIIHPEHWYMAARISKDGLWRISYGEKVGLSHDEILKRQPEKFAAMLPGNPTPEEYNMISISPYKVHQRLAPSMKVGRFLLAGDAAHLCNPFGGLGLTGGIVDVGNLFDCLYGIYQNKATDDILAKYSEVRRERYSNVVDPVSSSNLVRMYEADPETVAASDPFFQMCEKAKTDENTRNQLITGSKSLQYDFTKHYVHAVEYQDKQGSNVASGITVSG